MQILQTKSVELQALPYKRGRNHLPHFVGNANDFRWGFFFLFWKMNKTFGVRHSGLYYANGIN